MSGFTTPLNVTHVISDKFKLINPLVYWSDILQREVVVPAGFTTDFASVPELLPIAHAIFKDVGQKAAVLHDHLLTETDIPRSIADRVYYEALVSLNVGWKRYPMYFGVRAWTFIRFVQGKYIKYLT